MFDPTLLTVGSIIAVDLSTILVQFVNSDAGFTQSTSIPTQPYKSYTCAQDNAVGSYVTYLKTIKIRQWRLVLVMDGSFAFKDQVVRHKRNQTKETSTRTLRSIREGEYHSSVMFKLRRVCNGWKETWINGEVGFYMLQKNK